MEGRIKNRVTLWALIVLTSIAVNACIAVREHKAFAAELEQVKNCNKPQKALDKEKIVL